LLLFAGVLCCGPPTPLHTTKFHLYLYLSLFQPICFPFLELI
jgi:hypothetical protein